MEGNSMRLEASMVAAAVLGLAACNQAPSEARRSNAVPTANPVANEPQPAIPPPATGPDAKTRLAEPKGAIDPKSVEAAGQVVQHYAALIEQKRFAEAAKLWGSADSASQFESQLRGNAETHVEIGKPGDSEGAAGSIYVTEPVTFYGKDKGGAAFRRAADVILRRVNDVPGSTEAQRRWHIDQIEWKGAA
jgi:hypothetical protein